MKYFSIFFIPYLLLITILVSGCDTPKTENKKRGDLQEKLAQQTGPSREYIIIGPTNIPEDLQINTIKSNRKDQNATAQLQKWNHQVNLSAGKILAAWHKNKNWREIHKMINAERLSLETAKNPMIFVFDQTSSIDFIEKVHSRVPQSKEVDHAIAEHVAILDRYDHPDATVLVPAILRLKGSTPEAKINQYLIRAKRNPKNWLSKEACDTCHNGQLPEARKALIGQIKKVVA
ncbi:MAG: hypothetical protein JNN12_11350 [Bacteroidetes Order II. Incertae sedis bacterium]|nr:hypothetical protein [Bacteroidetes Order II. bacterium]